MSEFSRSMRSLRRDGFGRTTASLTVTALLLAGWAAWFFFARLPVYEVSDLARLEVDRAIHYLEAPVAGRVVRNALVLDRDVAEGEVLLALDSETERLQLEEEKSRADSLATQLDALHGQIAAEQRALDEEKQAAGVALQEAKARAREAEAAAVLAEEDLERLTRLHEAGQLADIDLTRGEAEAKGRRAAAESLRLAVGRLQGEKLTEQRDREVGLEELRREVRRLEGEIQTARATGSRLEHEVSEHAISAPVAGRLVEAAVLEIGAFVAEGDRVGVVLAPGNLKAVADYSPPAALGRIRPGQPARFRFEGFPWAQYGTLSGTVARVASELRDGLVRVEFQVVSNPASALPLQHGLPASVEVEIERATPAELVLRAAGRVLAEPANIPPGRTAGADSSH